MTSIDCEKMRELKFNPIYLDIHTYSRSWYGPYKFELRQVLPYYLFLNNELPLNLIESSYKQYVKLGVRLFESLVDMNFITENFIYCIETRKTGAGYPSIKYIKIHAISEEGILILKTINKERTMLFDNNKIMTLFAP